MTEDEEEKLRRESEIRGDEKDRVDIIEEEREGGKRSRVVCVRECRVGGFGCFALLFI